MGARWLGPLPRPRDLPEPADHQVAGLPVKEVVAFPRDTAVRKRYFPPEAMMHPAKMDLGLLMHLVSRYTRPGEVVLDPMGGIGSLLLACREGRNVVLVELEEHFVALARRAWDRIRALGPALGHRLGWAVILRGDARSLPFPGGAEAVLFSPPYEEHHQGGRDPHPERMQGSEAGLASRRYTDVVLTSPPWERAVHDYRHGLRELGPNFRGRRAWEERQDRGYGPDAVLTSPPYQIAEPGGGLNTLPPRPGRADQSGRRADAPSQALRRYTADLSLFSPPYAELHQGGRDPNPPRLGVSNQTDLMRYAHNGHSRNIGDLEGEEYWREMERVYREVYRVLRPGGRMVVVVKGVSRNRSYVDLPSRTAKVCQEVGFAYEEVVARYIPHLSFWRRLQAQRYGLDPRLRYEYALVFRKPALAV